MELFEEQFERGIRTRVVFGENTIAEAGNLSAELGATKVFIVTDQHIVAAGHVARLQGALDKTGIQHRRFDAVHENPSTADVDSCLRVLDDWQPDLWIGLGGGSSLDVAKAANLLRASGGKLEDYWGKDLAKGNLQPIIAVPTTAGTGSEMQSFTLIAAADSHAKMACGDPQMLPKIAILDPTLTLSQPQFVTICTGLDTLGHAIETAVCKARTKISTRFSSRALALVVQNLPRVLEAPDDLDARGKMMLAAAHAGVAIENSMLGAAHSLANPLTAHHGIAHGQAVGMMLPRVVRFNVQDSAVASTYAELARSAGLCDANASDGVAVETLINGIDELLARCQIRTSLASCGVPVSDHAELAREAAQQWTAQFNPRAVSVEDFVAMLADDA